ncbi:MAG TPA: MEDS domain-containing protein [Acidimicrobiales bacterium]|nr:MEDS domain-containing protein [Acidimicrobiales bacterium]
MTTDFCSDDTHAVRFYDSDEELSAVLAGFVQGGLEAGEVTILVATPEHAAALDVALRQAGTDPGRYRRDGYLHLVDADGLLGRFWHDGRINHTAFEAEVGGLLRRAGCRRRPVRVFGEMVALLWAAGQVSAAIELEELWSALGRRIPFVLLCGYQAGPTSDDHRDAARNRVCRLHHRVLGRVPACSLAPAPPPGAPEASRPLELSVKATSAARHFAVDTALRWDQPETVDDLALVATEMVTNAVVHGAGPCTMTLTRLERGIRVAVSDGSQVLPDPQVAGPGALTGRGLSLIARLAQRWGFESVPGGKIVWADLTGDARP